MKAFGTDDLGVETWVERSIADNGYAQISMHDPASGRPGFAVTIGLEASRDIAELFCMGVAPDIASRLFSLCIEGHDAGTIDLAKGPQNISDLVPGYTLRARHTPPDITRLANLYRPQTVAEVTGVMQILLPDNSGHFPGDGGCDPDIAAAQDPDWLLMQTTN